MRYQSLPENKGKPSHEEELDTQPIVLSTYADVKAFLLSDDESEEDILGAGKEMDEEPQVAGIAKTHHQSPPPQADKPQSSHAPSTEASDTDSSSDNILKKYDNTLPLTECQLVKYLREAHALKQDEELAGSVAPTLALTHIPANVKRKNATHTTTEEPPSHTEGETGEPKRAIPISTIQPPEVLPTQAQPITTIITHPESSQAASRIDKGKEIATESEEDSSKKLVPASTIVCPDPDALIPYTINGEVYHLTAEQLQAQIDKEELIKRSEEEVILFAISKPEVIKVVQEKAEKIRLDPKKIASAKAGEKFKKAQDAEHQVLKREHTEKVKKSLELRKHKFENYMWTINNKLKPETITDIRIHPKTKPVVITVYKGTDGRNFDVHKSFAFDAFGISKLDELREIIPKKNITVVQDLMNSLSKRYERIRKIPKEHGIKSALPTPVLAPKQASSKSSRKKRKHMELEPKVKIHGLEYNQALPKNVPFVNNMVIEELECGIFFTDEFGDQAFQRWSDIDKVGMEAFVSYLVAASLVKSPENARFSLKLKKLIAEHPDQVKLKSKKVKLEALRYEMN
ncbi:hypothetical protein Tco_0987028 [Tanacetum coccineum]